MTIHEFLSLNAGDQANQLLQEGIFIGKLTINRKMTMLFQLDWFYVKVTYRTYRKEVEKMECFVDPDKLYAYIEQVPIDELQIYP